jgi:hypothetical protein
MAEIGNWNPLEQNIKARAAQQAQAAQEAEARRWSELRRGMLEYFDGGRQGWHIVMMAVEQGEDPLQAIQKARIARDNALTYPPGFAGEIACYIHDAAPRPVREVAVVAALGLLAGICGKTWQIPKSGLNLYIMLIARSAIGKEAMHNGISELIHACAQEVPDANKFVDFARYASGPALIKACVSNPCFVNVSGELGDRIKQMSEGKDPALQSLKQQWKDLYQKSGVTSTVGGLGYSAQDNNVASIMGVAYSLIGESTPGNFLTALTNGMFEDGTVSRFCVIEYDGERPDPNANPLTTPAAELVSRLLDIIKQAWLMMERGRSQPVTFAPDAKQALDVFQSTCDAKIEGVTDEGKRAMWNRAHIKALRIAALLAVADRHLFPVIQSAHAEWAIMLVQRDIAAFAKHLEGGDVGDGDDARERKLVAIMREYLTQPIPASYKLKDEMRQNSIVARNYLTLRTRQAAAFSNHKLGTGRALDDTLASMVASGYLMECERSKMVEAYNYHGRAYRILKLPD